MLSTIRAVLRHFLRCWGEW